MPFDNFKITTDDEECMVYADDREFMVMYANRDFQAREPRTDGQNMAICGVQCRFGTEEQVGESVGLLMDYFEMDEALKHQNTDRRIHVLWKLLRNHPRAETFVEVSDPEVWPRIEWRRFMTYAEYNKGMFRAGER